MQVSSRGDIPVYLVVVACLAAVLLPGLLGPLLLIAGPLWSCLARSIGPTPGSQLVAGLDEPGPYSSEPALLRSPRPPPPPPLLLPVSF